MNLAHPSRTDAPASHAAFPLFDSLRALAAISILVVHVAIFSGGFRDHWYGAFVAHLDIGVPFFFLLSAFLLYRPFVAARVGGRGPGSLTGYARRRFLRIVPAYWAALTIAAVVPGMAGAFTGDWWVYYGLLQNYPIYTAEPACALEASGCGIPPTWSLAIEVMFYALLPLYALATAWLASRWKGRSWLGPELLVVAAISGISIWLQSFVPRSDLELWLFFSPVGRGWWFGLGLALAAISVRLAQGGAGDQLATWWGRRRWWAELSVMTALGLYLLSILVLLEPTPSLAFPVVDQLTYTIQYVLFGLIAALVLLPAIFDRDAGGPFRRALAHPTLAWLGLISYGIFLWQFPVMVALLDIGLVDGSGSFDFPLLLAATFAGTVVCAALSYYLLELPLMRRFRGAGRGRSGPTVGAPGTARPGRAPR